MEEYIVGGIFFTFFSLFLFVFGTAIIKDNENYSYKFIIGYVFYSFFVAIFGILVQIFNLSWEIFKIYMILLLLMICIYSIYEIKKHKIKIISYKLKDFIFEHWFLFALLLFLMFLTFFHYNAYWFNNHLDDSYYINKISIFPYVKNASKIIPATGFVNAGGINAYIINTHELEASFYTYMLNMTPTLYARFFLSGFQYFILINCIYAFASKIVQILNINYNRKTLQFIPAIIVLFAFNELFLRNKGILYLQDSNQFANAMYYGSSIVRTMGIMMLLLPFLNEQKINIKMIIYVMIVSLVLLSKSTIALPLIMATVISYTLINIRNNGFYGKIIQIVLVVLLLLTNILLNSSSKVMEIGNYAFQNFTRNISLIGFLPVIIVFILSFFFKSKVINKINYIFILLFIITSVPFLNNLISFFSFYAFVSGRTFTCFYYTLCILSCVYVYIFFFSLNMQKSVVNFISMITILSLGIGNVYSIQQAGGSLFYDDNLSSLNLIDSLKIIKNNNKFIPNSSLELGNILNRMTNESKQEINVISRELHTVNGSAYALATSLTSFSPQIKSISAKFRYKGELENEFSAYSEKDQMIYEKFMFQFDNNIFKKFKNILNKYPVNCVILVVNDKDRYMQELGFYLYEDIIDENAGVSYYVYKKK